MSKKRRKSSISDVSLMGFLWFTVEVSYEKVNFELGVKKKR